jgi:hypothetical protein
MHPKNKFIAIVDGVRIQFERFVNGENQEPAYMAIIHAHTGSPSSVLLHQKEGNWQIMDDNASAVFLHLHFAINELIRANER